MRPCRILLAEDDPVLVDGLSAVLRQHGHSVHCVSDGIHARDALAGEAYDVAILDLSMPRMDGLEVLRRLREAGSALPVLVISARGESGDRVAGLRAGADDYLAKPFDIEEFEARVESLLRRGRFRALEAAVPGDATRSDGLPPEDAGPQGLTPREQSILNVLTEHRGDLVSRERIASLIAASGEEISDNLIQIHMSRLRKKLAHRGAQIRTVRGMGYVLLADKSAGQEP